MMDGKQIVWDEIMPSIADGETEAYAESAPLADTIRTLPFLVDKVFMEVVTISTDSVQLRIENNSDMAIDVVPDYRRRRHQNYPGPFTGSGSFHIDFFDGQYWRLLTSYPVTIDWFFPDDYFAHHVLPSEYLIFDYCLALHPLPKQGIDRYRIVLDVLPYHATVTREMRQSLLDYRRAGGDIFFYTAGRPRHAIVAEFYWGYFNKPEAYDEPAPLADTIRTLPFLVDKISMEVVTISTDSVQLRIENNSDVSIDVVPAYKRRQHQNYPGPFTAHGSFHIDFFDGQYWRLLTPYPNLAKYEDVLDYFIAYRVYPNEYLIFDYYLDLHPLPKQGIEHYRIVLDVLPYHVTTEMRRTLLDYRRAGGDIFFYTAGWPRHAIVAEFYWDWD